MSTKVDGPIAAWLDSTTGRVLAVVALVFFWATAAHADGPPYEPGRYLLTNSTDGDSGGTLDIKAGRSAQKFKISAMGGNGHLCELEGTIKNDRARIPVSDGRTCRIEFTSGAGSVSVAVEGDDRETPSACRDFCGTGVWFEGEYVREIAECTDGAIKAARSRFKKLYDKRSYEDAIQLLAPLLANCADQGTFQSLAWSRNDLAVAYHRLGEDGACRSVLEPLADLAGKSDENLREESPLAFDTLIPIGKATRHNLRLCGAAARK